MKNLKIPIIHKGKQLRNAEVIRFHKFCLPRVCLATNALEKSTLPVPISIKLTPFISVFTNLLGYNGKSTAKMDTQVAINNKLLKSVINLYLITPFSTKKLGFLFTKGETSSFL